jgi:hypothetical protein
MTPAQPALDAMMEGLLPCPWCGGEAMIFRNTEACCKNEKCVGWTVNRCSIDKWNTRSDALAAEVRAQRETIAGLEKAVAIVRREMNTQINGGQGWMAEFEAALSGGTP